VYALGNLKGQHFMPHLEQHGVGAVVSSSKNCAVVLEAADKTWRRNSGSSSRKRTPL